MQQSSNKLNNLSSGISEVSHKEYNYHAKTVITAQWNCDGSFLASGAYDKSCKIASLEPQGTLKVCHVVNCSSPPSQIAWHPLDRNRFALGGDDVSIDLWYVRGNNYYY